MLLVEPEFEPVLHAAGLRSPAAIVARFLGDQATGAGGVVLQPGRLKLPEGGPLNVFFKLYSYRRPTWRFWARASKARCEFENYAHFRLLGIRSARRVACGEQRDALGRLRWAFILTQTIPEATPLPEFWMQLAKLPPAESRARRRQVLRQLAGMVQRAHRAGFFHYDLVWRNVLATWQPPAEPQLWWIDCPRGRCRHGPLRRTHRQIKDLASLDKMASRQCRAAERLDFLKYYLDVDCLDAKAKTLARKVVNYRRRRWPDEWR